MKRIVAAVLLISAALYVLPAGIGSARSAGKAHPTCPSSLEGFAANPNALHHGLLSREAGGRSYDLFICNYGPPAHGADYTIRVQLNWSEPGSITQVVCQKDAIYGVSFYDYSDKSISMVGYSRYYKDPKISEAGRSALIALRDQVEPYAIPCPGTEPTPPATPTPPPTPPSPPATTTTPPPAPAENFSCTVSGYVLDVNSQRVPGIRVGMNWGKVSQQTFTDANGMYQFTALESYDKSRRPLGDEFDPNVVSMWLEPKEVAHTPNRFFIRTPTLTGPRLYRKSFDPTKGCNQHMNLAADTDFDFAASQPNTKSQWQQMITVYQNFQLNWKLIDHLGLSDLNYIVPIPIYAFCDTGVTKKSGKIINCPVSAYFFGTNSRPGTKVYPDPHIGYASVNMGVNLAHAPDNRELHEFGHAFFTDLLSNAFPFGQGVVRNHAGYWINKDSSDEFSEGLAEFWTLIYKHEFGDTKGGARPWTYTVKSTTHDVETDKKAWDWAEMALAGVLLDLMDGPQDYATGDRYKLKIGNLKKAEGGDGVQWITGRVKNPEDFQIHNCTVTVTFTKNGKSTKVATNIVPSSLSTQQIAPFVLAVPHGWKDASFSASAGSGPSGDDDPINRLKPKEIIGAIAAYKSTFPNDSRYKRTINAVDLYRALAQWFAKDQHVVSERDLKLVFIKHGYFADIRGGKSNQRYDKGEVAVRSSHYGVATNPEMPDMTVRNNAEVPPALVAQVETELAGTDASNILVQVATVPKEDSKVSSHSYLTPLSNEGTFDLDVPSASTEASVYVTLFAPGFKPQLAAVIEADEFWKEANKNGNSKSFYKLDARLSPGSLDAYEMSNVNQKTAGVASGFSLFVFAVLVGFVLLRRTLVARLKSFALWIKLLIGLGLSILLLVGIVGGVLALTDPDITELDLALYIPATPEMQDGYTANSAAVETTPVAEDVPEIENVESDNFTCNVSDPDARFTLLVDGSIFNPSTSEASCTGITAKGKYAGKVILSFGSTGIGANEAVDYLRRRGIKHSRRTAHVNVPASLRPDLLIYFEPPNSVAGLEGCTGKPMQVLWLIVGTNVRGFTGASLMSCAPFNTEMLTKYQRMLSQSTVG